MTKPARTVGVAVVAALVVAIPAFASSNGKPATLQPAAAGTTSGFCVRVTTGTTGAHAKRAKLRRVSRVACLCPLGATGATGAKGRASKASHCGPPVWCSSSITRSGRVIRRVVVRCACRIPAGGSAVPNLSVLCGSRCPPPLRPGVARPAGVAILCGPCPRATGATGPTGPKGAITLMPCPTPLPCSGATGSTGSTGPITLMPCPIPLPCPGATGSTGPSGPKGRVAVLTGCRPIPCPEATGTTTAPALCRPPCGPPMTAVAGVVRPGNAVVCPLASGRPAASAGS